MIRFVDGGDGADLEEEGGEIFWYWRVVGDHVRTWWTVYREGWVVASAYLGSAGYRRAQRPLEEIPAALLATLPAEVQAVLLAK